MEFYFDLCYLCGFLFKDPDKICTMLGLCSNGSRAVLFVKQLKAPQGLMCDACMKITGEIMSALMSDSIEVSFSNFHLVLCAIMMCTNYRHFFFADQS